MTIAKLAKGVRDNKFVQFIGDRAGGITSLLGVVGMAGVLAYGLTRPPRDPDTVKSSYESVSGVDVDRNRLEDVDGDGDVDVIGSFENSTHSAYWVAPGMQEKVKGFGYDVDGRTGVMTPEIQDLATQVLKAQRLLNYTADKEAFRLYNERVSQKGKK